MLLKFVGILGKLADATVATARYFGDVLELLVLRLRPFRSDGVGNPSGKKKLAASISCPFGIGFYSTGAVFMGFRAGCRYIAAFLRHCVGISQLLVLLLQQCV